jgi:hypothetical protein
MKNVKHHYAAHKVRRFFFSKPKNWTQKGGLFKEEEYQVSDHKILKCNRVSIDCPKRYVLFPGSMGNAEGNSSDGRKLFMLIFPPSTGKRFMLFTKILKKYKRRAMQEQESEPITLGSTDLH